MYILDTDHATLYQQGHPALGQRLAQLPPNQLTTSVIFQQLTTLKLRIGTQDLLIASITLANEITLLTRNLRDFQRVPGLALEDWSVPPS